MITLKADDRKLTSISHWPITSGSVGLGVQIQFSNEWDGLSKTAVFRGSGVTVDVPVTINNTTGECGCTVPHEVLAQAGGDLYIGVYGANGAGTIVIPTIWTNAGYIKEGTMLSEVDPADPTPSWVAQVQAWAENALSIAGELSAKVTKTGNEAIIKLTYYDSELGATRTTTATITDGAPGQNGTDGVNGVSPIISVATITGGHRLKIVDAAGTNYVDIMDGQDGVNGQNGTNGEDGEDGADGSLIWKTDVAPTVQSGIATWSVSDLDGRIGADPQVGDLVFYSYYYYPVTRAQGSTVVVGTPVNIRGPQGEPGGGGSGDYDDLTDKPQINSVTLSGNKSLADLGIAAATDIPTVDSTLSSSSTNAIQNKAVYDAFALAAIALNGKIDAPSSPTDGDVLAYDGGWKATALSASDVGAIAAPPTTTDGDALVYDSGLSAWTAAALTASDVGALPDSATAADIGAIAAPSSPATGAFLVYDGTAWVAQTLSTWSGGNY